MWRILAVFFSGLLFGAIGTGFFSALPLPFAAVALPVILIVTAHMRLQHGDGHALACGTGLALEVLTPHFPPGSMFALLLLVSTVLSFLTRRVFTHFSLIASVSLHMIAALVWFGGLALIVIVGHRVNGGLALQHMTTGAWFAMFFAHLVVAEVITFLSRGVRYWVGNTFILRSSSPL